MSGYTLQPGRKRKMSKYQDWSDTESTEGLSEEPFTKLEEDPLDSINPKGCFNFIALVAVTIIIILIAIFT